MKSKNNNIRLLLLLSVVTLIFGIISKNLLNANDLLINSLSEQLSYSQIEEFLDFQGKWEWISYVLIILMLFLKISIISAILDVGCFFFSKEIKYKKKMISITGKRADRVYLTSRFFIYEC